MKKLGILLMSVLALGFVACDDYDEALPQTNPQGPVVAVNGLEVAAGEGMAAQIDLNTFTGDAIQLINTVKTPALNEGNGVTYDVQIAADEAFAKYKQYSLTYGTIEPSVIDAAFRELYGKTPNQKPLYFRFVPYLTDGESKVLFAKDTYLMASKMEVKPVDLGIVIEPGYLIVTDLWFGDGWADNLVEFEHAETDLYDDPIFKVTTELPAGSIQIIGSESLEKAKNDEGNEFMYVWGPKDENATAGDLVLGESATAINIAEEGTYTITIDMLNRTFAISKVVPTMYMIGGFCGWNWDNAPIMVPGWANGKTTGKYWVVAHVDANAGFKFNTAAAWDGGEFGFDGATLVSHVAGVDFANDGGNIALTKGGWYIFGVEKAEGAAGYEFTVNVFEPNIYVYGPCANGSWGDSDDWKFTVPETADGDFISPALAVTGELRLCVHPLTSTGEQFIGDWWQSEFIYFNGEIAYRGQGGDQDRVTVEAQKRVHLNFVTGKAFAE